MSNLNISSSTYSIGASRRSQLAKFDEGQLKAYLQGEVKRKQEHIRRVLLNSGKFDAKESLILQRQAIAIEATQHMVEITPQRFRSMASVVSDGTGLESVGYHESENYGEFGFSPANGQEVPVSKQLREEFLIPVAHAKGMIRYTIRDMEKAARAGMTLSALQLTALRENAETFLNRIFHYGDKDRKLPGFLRDLGTFNETTISGGPFSTKITTDTLGVAQDVIGMLTAVANRTGDRHYANTVATSPAIANLLKTTPMSVDNTTSIWTTIVNNAPGDVDLQLISTSLMAAVPSTAEGLAPIVDGKDVLMVYDNNPRILSYKVPRELELQPMQPFNDEFRQFGLIDVAGTT